MAITLTLNDVTEAQKDELNHSRSHTQAELELKPMQSGSRF